MPREGARTKSLRYLAEGRLQIYRADESVIRAKVRGSGAEYFCGFDEVDQAWWCSCPARSPNCAHVLAAKTVTVAPLPRAPRR
jgi:uncharacterized Zn finger protein